LHSGYLQIIYPSIVKGEKMKKHRLILQAAALVLVLSLFLGVGRVQASTYPTFSISAVEKDVSVTILTKDMPANKNFKALMGEIGTRAEGGIEVATFNSGEGGAFTAKFTIPAALKGRAQIAIRVQGTDNPYFAYNWFWNDPTGTVPGTTEPDENPPDCGCGSIPTFSITSVTTGKTVSIRTNNFPKNIEFKVLMGKMWTRGINGIEVAKLNSGAGGTFEATFDIPAALAGEERVSIRLEGSGGYFAYNWFWNNTSSEPPTPPVDGYSGYPYFFIESVVRDSTVTIKAYNVPANYEFKVLMGKMWTRGIGGIQVATLNSGAGGTLTATYNIPAELAGSERISIRLQGNYYYAYNWFWNNTAN
jgi:hypothetical protein